VGSVLPIPAEGVNMKSTGIEIELLARDYHRVTIPVMGDYFGGRVITLRGPAEACMMTFCCLCDEEVEDHFDYETRTLTVYCLKCKTFLSLTEEEINVIAGGTHAEL